MPSVKGSPDKPATSVARPAERSARGDAPDDRDIGAALQGIYQRTVDEAVPDDLLSLLSKLD